MAADQRVTHDVVSQPEPLARESAAADKTAPWKVRHVGHVEGWKAVTTQPDLCKVGSSIVAFDSCANLDKKQKASANVVARGTPVYRLGDMFKAVQGNAGAHVVSGTSQGGGFTKIIEGHHNVKVNNIPVGRHDSQCMINCNGAGAGGALGKLVTERKSASGPSIAAKNPDAPPGKRTSEKLEELTDAKAKVESSPPDIGPPDYADDKTQRMRSTGDSQAFSQLSQLDGAILVENIRLGNITPGAMGQGVLNMGAANVRPVIDPWTRERPAALVSRAVPEKAQAAVADGVHVKSPAPKPPDAPPKRVVRFAFGALPQAMINYAGEPYELFADGASVEKSIAGQDGTFAWEHKEGTKQYEVVLVTGQRFKVDALESFDGSAGQQLANRGYRGYQHTASDRAEHAAEDDAFREVVFSGKNKA